MEDGFKEFLAAEVNEIMSSMDDVCRQNPELCRRLTFDWIEKNAEVFRSKWNAQREKGKEWEKARAA